jgi:hypothetical protein
MKSIIYILLGIFLMLEPRQSFAIIGHQTPTTTQTVVANHVQKSKWSAKKNRRMSSEVFNFLAFATLSVLSLIVGLILLNWWLIILGAIGVSLIILFIYLLSHMTWR